MVGGAVLGDTRSLVRFHAAGIGFAVERATVRGIHHASRLRRTPGPRAEGTIVGVLSDAQGDVPVYCLAERLGRTTGERPAQQQIVVLDAGLRPWGLLVDRVGRVQSVPAEALGSLPAAVGDVLGFQGVLRLDGELVLMLAAESLDPEAPPLPVPYRSFRVPSRAAVSRPAGQRPVAGQLLVVPATDRRKGERVVSFGFSIAQVAEVLDFPPLTTVPGSPADVLGLALWRDQPISVLDFGPSLGLPPTSTAPPKRLLVLRPPGSAEPIGLLIRPSVRVLRLPVPHQPCTRSLDLDPALILAAVELRYETLVLPDLRGR